MERKYLEDLLKSVANENISVDEAMEKLKDLPYEDMGFANIDNHRRLRTGQGEVIFAQGKTPKQAAEIAKRMYAHNERVLMTRADRDHYQAVKEIFSNTVSINVDYEEASGIIVIGSMPEADADAGSIAVVTAGTSDIPVAEEAALTAEYLGCRVDRIFDVGVAGIHRLFGKMDRIHEAEVLIVVAGMEGALASVVAGLVDKPVIAVPTSVGYGASFGGLAALLSMLNSCANGVGVVNIDNGYGAACLAAKILKRKH